MENAETIMDLEAELQYYKDKYMSLNVGDSQYQATLTKIQYLREKIEKLKE